MGPALSAISNVVRIPGCNALFNRWRDMSAFTWKQQFKIIERTVVALPLHLVTGPEFFQLQDIVLYCIRRMGTCGRRADVLLMLISITCHYPHLVGRSVQSNQPARPMLSRNFFLLSLSEETLSPRCARVLRPIVGDGCTLVYGKALHSLSEYIHNTLRGPEHRFLTVSAAEGLRE